MKPSDCNLLEITHRPEGKPPLFPRTLIFKLPIPDLPVTSPCQMNLSPKRQDIRRNCHQKELLVTDIFLGLSDISAWDNVNLSI